MTIYGPILKGKPGEFAACRNASANVLANSRVVMEVVPNDGETRDLTKFVNGLAAQWQRGYVVTIDTGFLDQTVPIGGTADCAVMWAAAMLNSRGVQSRPVMRLDDDPDVLAEIAAASALQGADVCLRIGSEESYPDPDEADSLLGDALEEADLTPTEIHLLIDLRAVESGREVQLVTTIATNMLGWADANGPWASVTVASGSFPASISNLPTGVAPSPLTRFDANLYDSIIAASPPVIPDFGDYAVNHPSMPTAAFRGPLPNLRYTSGRDWQVWRERKILPGNESFFTLCGNVVASAHWPGAGAGYSWGDQEIQRCAASTGGAGTATQWRAYGTSHHMAHVIDRLATLGVP